MKEDMTEKMVRRVDLTTGRFLGLDGDLATTSFYLRIREEEQVYVAEFIMNSHAMDHLRTALVPWANDVAAENISLRKKLRKAEKALLRAKRKGK